MRGLVRSAVWTVCVLGLSACAQLTTGVETVAQLPRYAVEGTGDFFIYLFTRPETKIEAVSVGRLPNCNTVGREPSLELFTDVDAVKAWEAQRGISLTPETGGMPPGFYVVAEMGERSTGGYSLATSREAAVKDDVLYIKASFLSPSNASQVTAETTSPCSLVLVPTRSYNKAVLLDQSNTVRARWFAPGVKR